jgi:hypothetical protein
MMAFLRESAQTVHFLSVPECEIQAELCEELIAEGGYCVSEECILLKKVCSFVVG